MFGNNFFNITIGNSGMCPTSCYTGYPFGMSFMPPIMPNSLFGCGCSPLFGGFGFGYPYMGFGGGYRSAAAGALGFTLGVLTGEATVKNESSGCQQPAVPNCQPAPCYPSPFSCGAIPPLFLGF